MRPKWLLGAHNFMCEFIKNSKYVEDIFMRFFLRTEPSHSTPFSPARRTSQTHNKKSNTSRRANHHVCIVRVCDAANMRINDSPDTARRVRRGRGGGRGFRRDKCHASTRAHENTLFCFQRVFDQAPLPRRRSHPFAHLEHRSARLFQWHLFVHLHVKSASGIRRSVALTRSKMRRRGGGCRIRIDIFHSPAAARLCKCVSRHTNANAATNTQFLTHSLRALAPVYGRGHGHGVCVCPRRWRSLISHCARTRSESDEDIVSKHTDV